MYKITLFDQNLCSFVSGTTSFFVDEIKEFEKIWLTHSRVSDEQKERYQLSKAGELVSDYYVTNDENNIFQKDDDASILEELEFVLNDKEFHLHNFFEYERIVYAKKAIIKYRKIKFKNDYVWIGRYQLFGVCAEDYLEENSWITCKNWGNPVLVVNTKSGDWIRSQNKETFAQDYIESYCWIPVLCSHNENEYPFNKEFLLSVKVLEYLMCDILGEAG